MPTPQHCVLLYIIKKEKEKSPRLGSRLFGSDQFLEYWLTIYNKKRKRKSPKAWLMTFWDSKLPGTLY